MSTHEPAEGRGGARPALDARTAIAIASEREAEVAALEAEVEHLRGRERHFARILGIADGGKYRNDWDARLMALIQSEEQARGQRDGLLAAIEGLVTIVAKAGLLNLSNGVQLGPTVWYVKASDAMEYAQAVVGDVRRAVPCSCEPGDPCNYHAITAGSAVTVNAQPATPPAADPVHAALEGLLAATTALYLVDEDLYVAEVMARRALGCPRPDDLPFDGDADCQPPAAEPADIHDHREEHAPRGAAAPTELSAATLLDALSGEGEVTGAGHDAIDAATGESRR